MNHIAIKPKGTFYSDYTIQNGKLYAIFEHDSRVSNIMLCKTDKTNADARQFEVTETATELIINLGE
jgi:hypothetical protein